MSSQYLLKTHPTPVVLTQRKWVYVVGTDVSTQITECIIAFEFTVGGGFHKLVYVPGGPTSVGENRLD